VLFFCSVYCEVDPNITVIRRTIRHILDYGTRQNFSVGPPGSGDLRYTPDDRLIPGHYSRPTLFHTTFFSRGWGWRRLSDVFRVGLLTHRLRISTCPLLRYLNLFSIRFGGILPHHLHLALTYVHCRTTRVNHLLIVIANGCLL
jgi:hypothetical protein